MDRPSADEYSMPTLEFRMQTARLLVQIQKYKPAVTVLEMITQEDDEQIEAWYLMAFSFYKRDRYKNAQQCCMNIQKVAKKLKIIINPELETAAKEIWEGCEKAVAKAAEEMDDGQQQ